MRNRLIAYLRLSEDRDLDKTGTDSQLQDIERVAARKGVELVAVLADPDASAYRKGSKRPDFDRGLAMFDRGEADGFIVYKIDRLARASREWAKVLPRVDDHGMRAVDCQGLDTNDGESARKMLGYLAEQARGSSADTADRVKRKWQHNAEQGLPHPGRHRPFGHSADWLEVVPAEAAAIRDARDRIFAGETRYAILADWRERGLRPVTGDDWSTRGFKKLMTSARIAGAREVDGRLVVTGAFPAIVTPTDLERLRVVLERPQRAGRPVAPDQLLGDLARCAHCGHRLYIQKGAPGVGYYSCVRSVPGAPRKGCGRVAAQVRHVDALVTEAVVDALEGFTAKGSDDSALDGVAVRLAEIADQEDDLAVMFARKTITQSQLAAGTRELRAEAEHLSSRLARFRVPRITGDVRAEWDRHGIEWRRGVVRAVLDRVTIASANRRGRVFDPDRVTFHWLDQEEAADAGEDALVADARG